MGMSIFRQIFCLKNLISFMGLLEDIQAELEERTLPTGGWASGSGSRATVETTCYVLMALHDRSGPARNSAIDFLLRVRNQDGSWPAFEGDDPEGCWTTALALIALRFVNAGFTGVDKSLSWLLENKGREGHWFWKWKFKTVDRAVQFNPDKFGWPWFPGTVSWIIPTAFTVIALKQWHACCGTEKITDRIHLGIDMLRDRACPQGGWNAGNGIVFGAALKPHVDSTAIALLALSREADPVDIQALKWLREACVGCPSAFSLAWSVIAFSTHEDPALDHCLADLHRALFLKDSVSNIETLGLAAIAINAAEGKANPFMAI